MELAELTPEEKTKPYAKYYYLPPAPPDQASLERLQPGKSIDPDQALAIGDISDLLRPGYMDVETGYCVLPSGAGYLAVNTKMPGVTVEMVNWWFAWHGLADLRYKIWWPAGHFAVSISDADRKKVLDPKGPLTGKFQGITHHVVEDVGAGPEDIFISFLAPEDMGFDMSRFLPPRAGTVVGANGLSAPVGAAADVPRAPAVMCHFVREIAGGVEFRTRFWPGYHIVGRKPKLMMPPGARVPEALLISLGQHNVHEYCNLRAILPRIYAEQRGVIAGDD